MGTKYTKITGGTNSKNFPNRLTPESQKISATRPARNAKTDIGSVKRAWDSEVMGPASISGTVEKGPEHRAMR